MSISESTFTYFSWRHVWKFSITFQVYAIIFLYLVSVFLGYREYQITGLLQGFPFRTGILFVPIYEEVIFRGCILGYLTSKFSPNKAILFSSILFGLWHVKNIFVIDATNLIHQIIYTMCIFGPLTAWITIKTKTLWPSVIIHYGNNLIAVYGSFIWNLIISSLL